MTRGKRGDSTEELEGWSAGVALPPFIPFPPSSPSALPLLISSKLRLWSWVRTRDRVLDDYSGCLCFSALEWRQTSTLLPGDFLPVFSLCPGQNLGAVQGLWHGWHT